VCGIAAAKPLWKMGPQKPKISFFCGEAAVTITAHAVGGTIIVIVLFEVRE
jgi:hypothetical protein